MHCELREVVLRNKPPSMLAASPKGTVPVLLLADRVVEESLEIMLWTLRQRDPQGWLALEPTEQQRAMALIERNDGQFKHHLDRYKYASRHEDEEPGVDHRGQAAVFLQALDDRLQRTPWLFGQALSLADAAIAPFVRQFANTDRSWFDQQDWSSLVAWLDDFLASDLFLSVMHKYPPWKPEDEPTVFPRTTETGWLRS